MDTDKVIQELNKRFAAPLPDFYKRRIIFWHDEEKEFVDRIDDIKLDGVKIVKLTGSNTYTVKKLLCSDDLTSNFLVYSPLSFNRPDDNWLINVELYSEEFRADLISVWMEEMHMATDSQEVRSGVKHYRKFFNASPRREKVKAFGQAFTTEAHVHRAVMAALCGNKDTKPENIIRAVLSAGLENENNEIYQNFINYGADDSFWKLARQATGYDEEQPTLDQLAIHTLLTATARTMHSEYLEGLKQYVSDAHQTWCYGLVMDWMNGSYKEQFYEIARFTENEKRLKDRFFKLSIEDIVETGLFPCIDECILTFLMTDICSQNIQPDIIKQTVEKRKTMAWYNNLSCYYDGIFQVAKMQQFLNDHADGFHTVKPAEIWKEYTSNYYKMDTYYRIFQLNFQQSLKCPNENLDDYFKQVADIVEGIYTNRFLRILGENWTNACEDDLKKYGRILGINQQTEFYRDKIADLDNRVYVIVSDALRYEVAVSLKNKLCQDMQGEVTLESREAVFPTATKYGMAALLPHDNLNAELHTNNQITILADGQSTDGIENRNQILKNANSNSIALRYEDIIHMKKKERQQKMHGMDVIYIYHDKIDESSHTNDNEVFPACDEAIKEIENIVRIIVGDNGGGNFVITSDHGFIYTYKELTEDSKISKTSTASQNIEVKRRYIITKKGTITEFLMPVNFLEGKADFDAFAPKEYVRIKATGGGLNYVHGGASLQEMVVPVIEYHHLRNGYKTYQKNKENVDTRPVSVQLLSSNRKISNMVFSQDFYQKEAVSGNVVSCNYLLYFTDASGNPVSDTQKIIADKTSADGTERTFHVKFNLRSQKFDSRATYYLVIADESGLQMPEKIEFQIDIAFAVDEFNFFD